VGSNPTSPITCHGQGTNRAGFPTNAFIGFTVMLRACKIAVHVFRIMTRFLAKPFAILVKQCLRSGLLLQQDNFPDMGSLKKRRKAKISKHKRRKRMKENRHKKRLRYKS
jgi:hypothetical protein